jgi:hypothetical protein
MYESIAAIPCGRPFLTSHYSKIQGADVRILYLTTGMQFLLKDATLNEK